MGDDISDEIPSRSTNLRLVQLWLRSCFCRIYIPNHRLPNQLPLSVCTPFIGNSANSTRYFIITNLAETEDQVIRYAALLRGTESAWQAISYGLTSVPIMGSVGAVYINFGLWAVAIVPAWILIRHFGADWDHYGHDGKDVSPERVPDIKI